MSVLLSIVFVILICSTAVLVAALSYKTAQNALSTLDSLHKRQSEANDKTLDRLMTIRWEDFLSLQSSTDEDAGGFIPPEEQEDGDEEEEKGRWGHLQRLRLPGQGLSDEERALLDEDFPTAEEA